MPSSNIAKIIDQIKPKPDFVFNPRVEQSRILQRPAGGLIITPKPLTPEK